MFCTTQDIKELLMISNSPTQNVFDAETLLLDYDDSYLQNILITSASEVVKAIRRNTPYQDALSPITLIENVTSRLTYQKIVKGSVVVANDITLAIVYVENVDYVIDYYNGTIAIASTGSSIPSGGTVYVWYLPFTVLSRDTDYSIDYSKGTIRRVFGTSVPSNSICFIDYAHSDQTVPDAAITSAIKRAQSIISDNLSEQYSLSSPDEGLKSAAMYFTAYLLSLALSSREITLARSDSSSDISNAFRSIAKDFLATAQTNFSKYLKTSSMNTLEIIANRAASPANQRAITPPTVTHRDRKF